MNSLIKERLEKIHEGIVPEGYKKTKVGIIPEDWEVRQLEKIISSERKITYGIVQPGEFDDSGRYLIRAKDYSNNWVGKEEFFKVSDLIEEKYKRARVMKEDVLLTIVGSIGNIAYVPDWLEGSNITQQTARLAFNESISNKKYYYYYFQYDLAKKEINRYLKTGVQPSLNLSDISKFNTLLPPLEEQEEIANILSTWDKAIENIEKLIKEKEIQKKGLMRQLLTGETRLPGFTGEWEEVKLGDASNYISSGITKNRLEYGKYLVYGSTGIIGYSNKNDYEGTKILIARVGENAGLINRADGRYGVSDNTLILDLKLDNIDYIYYYLMLFNLNKLVYGTGQPLIKGGDLKEIKLTLPPLSEQNAIAKILSTADKEIELLNQLLENKKEEKKGLMQLLLTGIVRV